MDGYESRKHESGRSSEPNGWGHTIGEEDFGASDVDSFTDQIERTEKVQKRQKTRAMGHSANTATVSSEKSKKTRPGEDIWERHYDFRSKPENTGTITEKELKQIEEFDNATAVGDNNWGHTIEENDIIEGASEDPSIIQQAISQEQKPSDNEEVWARHYDFRTPPEDQPQVTEISNRQETEAGSLAEAFQILSDNIVHEYENDFRQNNELLENSLATGVKRSIERGIFGANGNSLLHRGFWTKEEGKIQDRIDVIDDYSDEAFNATRELKSRIGKLLDEESDSITTGELSVAKYEGSLDAIATGARIDGRSGKIIYAIPLDKGEEVKEYMKNAGIDFENDEIVRQESYRGFISILEVVKRKHDLTDDGFKALDWYYDNFGYNKNSSEFENALDGYVAEADLAFHDKYDEYLDYRDEIKKLRAERISRDQETLEKLSDLIEITTGRDFYDLDYEEIFPRSDTNKPKKKKGESRGANWPSGEQKIDIAYPKLKAIVQLDPNATFYQGEIFKDNSHPYIIARFGTNGMNNVIVIPYGDTSDAMFCWRGETGDDRDGWKAYFKDTSIRTRDTEVKRFQCNGFSEDEIGAMNREWDRIEDYLGIKLPDYEPLVEGTEVSSIPTTEEGTGIEEPNVQITESKETKTGTDDQKPEE